MQRVLQYSCVSVYFWIMFLLPSCGHTARFDRSQEPLFLTCTQNIIYNYDLRFINGATNDSSNVVAHVYEVQEDSLIYEVIRDLDLQVISRVFSLKSESPESGKLFFFETLEGLWRLYVVILDKELTDLLIPVLTVPREWEVGKQWMSTRSQQETIISEDTVTIGNHSYPAITIRSSSWPQMDSEVFTTWVKEIGPYQYIMKEGLRRIRLVLNKIPISLRTVPPPNWRP